MSVRVLVVDDTPANLRLLKNKLRSRYFEVETAEDGPAGLALARSALPDVILLDVMMPGMSGYEVCRQLKAERELAQIPVIMLTSLTDQSSRNEGLAAGADDFLSRPVDDEALFHRLVTLARISTNVRQLETQVRTVSSLYQGGMGDVGEVDFSRLRVLLADPDDESRRILATALSARLSVQLFELADPISDAGLPPDSQADLLIINIDSMDADHAFYAASQFVGRANAGSKPAIALCASFDSVSAQKAERSGIADCVILPFDETEMVARVRSHLARAQYVKGLEALYTQAIDAALTDELTGLYNRRFATSHIEQVIEEANKSGRQLGLMMIDLDDFKGINDRFGHQAGDDALRSVADTLRSSLRQCDMVARWGGDEFLVLLPEIERQELEQLAARLLKAVGKLKAGPSWRDPRLSLSMGAALTAGDESIDWLEVLRRADRALYRVKERGKSGFEVA